MLVYNNKILYLKGVLSKIIKGTANRPELKLSKDLLLVHKGERGVIPLYIHYINKKS